MLDFRMQPMGSTRFVDKTKASSNTHTYLTAMLNTISMQPTCDTKCWHIWPISERICSHCAMHFGQTVAQIWNHEMCSRKNASTWMAVRNAKQQLSQTAWSICGATRKTQIQGAKQNRWDEQLFVSPRKCAVQLLGNWNEKYQQFWTKCHLLLLRRCKWASVHELYNESILLPSISVRYIWHHFK